MQLRHKTDTLVIHFVKVKLNGGLYDYFFPFLLALK